MPDAWKHLNLQGQGLQSLNLRLTRQLRRPRRAYALMLLFPLGLHRAYLGDARGAWAWRLGCLTAAALPLWTRPWGFLVLLPLTIALLADALRIEQRCAAYNRALRRRMYFSPGTEPPKDFRGRQLDDAGDQLQDYLAQKRGESPSPHTPVRRSTGSRPLSFNEQEALLKELARRPDGARGKSR